jgi:uncharacterized protein YndB with AHSA1/START domain
MTVTAVHKDPKALTMTITTELDAPVARAWQLWDDPRQLERWWGPPTYPATFVDHDLSPGGTVTYFMTGPEGDQPHGWWRVLAVDAPNHLEFEDGFADGNGAPDPAMPVMVMRVDLHDRPGGGTRMTIETAFASVDDMEKILSMGMEEGMSAALGQMDDVLRVGASPGSP